MGSADTFGKAYDKAQDATGKPIPQSGTIALDLSDEVFPDPDTEAGEELVDGFGEFFEFSEAVDLIDAARAGELDIIVSRNRDLLEVAVEEEITYFSTPASARAAIEALQSSGEPLDVQAISGRPKRVAEWGK
jgi:carbamoyl-phosphate synthase large subunit